MLDDYVHRRQEEKRVKSEGRLPPNQSLTLKFPVLHYGPVPPFDPATWDLKVFGEVEQEMSWDWNAFKQIPTAQVHTDIHCVTGWSKFDTVWEGPLFRDFVQLFGVKPAAQYVIAHCEFGFTTNLPLDVMLEDDVLLAWKFNGDYLEPDHGYPVRTFVPQRYFWKSAKWLRKLEFSATDKPGFWEQAGYHNDGDPWKEERYQRRGRF
ncbi:MAG TPA: sulfite oxidase-like oxidoreductase [Aggregatilinea sp.]|jgi:DMSO/TMAO reductase YedYZ molybdopterin-dependent catalytic subunit|uniref:sulfite oxidase-like oxidoreductase n=1 Tax=Aggregatilinea sp. TaxID=2806333 RepID=UPI002BBB40BD|nr:sulfite oxidase-like oxidoreductase [Aggregatilinea sp.]HML22215.1 sulfite oxidase-like oxidoreductase [Aggregatilinea sp.]